MAFGSYFGVNELWMGLEDFYVHLLHPKVPYTSTVSNGLYPEPVVETQFSAYNISFFTTYSCFQKSQDVRFVYLKYLFHCSKKFLGCSTIQIPYENIHVDCNSLIYWVTLEYPAGLVCSNHSICMVCPPTKLFVSMERSLHVFDIFEPWMFQLTLHSP